MKLTNIADYVTEKISSENILLENYITTDNLLPDKQGRTIASNLPPQKCTLTKYAKGDVLIANIRPYLKKIWMADGEGGASNDVLVFRAKEGYDSSFVYAVLLQDSFYSWVMKAPRGSQMPRGDKNHIMNFNVSDVPGKENIGKLLSNLDRKIALNRQINTNLEALARQLYDYWFVQFDFPDANGNPYKSSGGKMTYNEKLKRHIPDGWEVKTLGDICEMYQPKTLGLNELSKDGQYLVYGANGTIGKYHSFNHENSEIAMACRGNSCGTLNRTMPKSWITGNAMVIQLKDNEIHNEFIRHALSYTNVQGVITGSGQPQITRENLQKIQIQNPSKEVLLEFSKKIEPIIDMEIQIEREISSLTRQRDELLPLLMNGQVSVE